MVARSATKPTEGSVESTVLNDWDEFDVIAAAATCPMPDCGGLVVAFRPMDCDAEPWEFTCPRCGIDFIVPEEELVFQSVPNRCLLTRAYAA